MTGVRTGRHNTEAHRLRKARPAMTTTTEIMALADAFVAEVKNDYQGMDGVQRRVHARQLLLTTIECSDAAIAAQGVKKCE